MPETTKFGLLHEGEGEPPAPLTWAQIYMVQRALYIWQRVYEAEKGEKPDLNNTANLTKSCLLGRMLTTGKLPLDLPPPTADSAPWYQLVETGEAHFTTTFANWWPHDFPDGRKALGIHGHLWTRVRDLEGGGWEVSDLGAPGRWEMRPLREGEDRKVVGRSIASGKPEDIFSDWILKRMDEEP
jgi:hypothetical protein